MGGKEREGEKKGERGGSYSSADRRGDAGLFFFFVPED